MTCPKRCGWAIASLSCGDGAVIQMGTPEEIVADPADEYVADFTRDVRRSTVLTVGYLMDRQGTKRASAEASRPNARVSFKQTVDGALSEFWSTPGQLGVMDEWRGFGRRDRPGDPAPGCLRAT